MRSLSRVLRFFIAPGLLAVTMTATGLAFAGDTLTAEHLFRQGLDAMKNNKFKEACEAFSGSNDADASPGTEINLALCNEKQGKLASAWGWYRTAAGHAEQRNQKERADLAHAEAAKLEPKLHKLVVTVKVPVEGMVITRNGAPVPSATLGSDVPIDPGDYTIEVTAKGKRSWKSGNIHVAAGPGLERVEVPPLEDAPPEPKAIAVGGPAGPPGADYGSSPPPRDGSTQRTIGLITGGVGLVAGVVAVVFEVVAVKEQDKSVSTAADADKIKPVSGSPTFKAETDNKASLGASASDHHKAASSDEAIAIATGIGAVVLVGVGVTIWLTAPTAKASSGGLTRPLVVPFASRDRAGLGLVGRF